MLIAQITDLHVEPNRRLVGGRVDTVQALQTAVSHLNELRPRPDLVAISGDLTQDGTVEQCIALDRALAALTLPVIVIPGNHDRRETLRTVFAGRYGIEAGGERADAPFAPVMDLGPVRVIGVDTVVPGRTHGGLDAERLATLEARLRERPEAPTLLVLHHPPFQTGVAAMDAVGLIDGVAALAETVGRHGQVQRMICGHVHRRIDARFAGIPASTAPSSSHQIALTLGRDGDPNQGAAAGYVLEPPCAALHVWAGPDQGFVSHLSFIGPYPGPIPFSVDA